MQLSHAWGPDNGEMINAHFLNCFICGTIGTQQQITNINRNGMNYT